MANSAQKPAFIASADVASVYDTLTLTKGLFEAAYIIAENRMPELLVRQAMDAAIYAIEEKVEAAEKKIEALLGHTD